MLGEGRWTVGDPVVDEEGDAGIGEEVEGLLGGWVRGHDDCWVGGVGSGGKVGVVHEGDVRGWIRREGAGCEMEL